MSEKFDKYVLNNGMVVLGEPMEAVESVAFGFMIPAGASVLAEGCCGASNVISDWIFRGAGTQDSRQLSNALDGLGLHRTGGVNGSHLTVGATLESGNLGEALNLYADIILRPRLDEEQFEPARQLVIDGVLGLDDDPRQKVMLKLKEQFYPSPLGRSIAGNIEELKSLTPAKTKEIVDNQFDVSQIIFSIAGKYNFNSVCGQLESLFGTETGKQTESISIGTKAGNYKHIKNDGAQVHIGLMVETVKPTEPNYYNAMVAVSVLSGGMSARLFTEVREKRGLCYAIGARYHGLKEAAGMMCYAGTAPDKAQETLDVITAEFNGLGEGISVDEIERAKVGLKSSLILSSESSSSRAGGIGGDYYMLERVRSLEEIKSKIEEITVNSVLDFLRNNKFKDFTVVTIGPKEVTVG